MGLPRRGLVLLVFVAAACGDDEGLNPTPDAGAIVDSGGSADAGCCTEAMCEADGLVCNLTTCTCEPLMGGACRMSGQPCDPSVGQASVYLCVPDGAGSGVCRKGCGATSTCPDNEVCTDGVPRFCAPGCNGFFDNNCPGSANCLPTASGTGVCIPTGMVAEGGTCDASVDCGAGLLCAGSECIAPECAPISQARTCPNATDECSPFMAGTTELDVGLCVSSCDPFASPDLCPSNEWCMPTSRGQDNLLRGRCTTDTGGTATEGETCEVTPGLDCAEPYLCVAGICRSFCDPMSATTMVGECPSPLMCVELNSGNETLPFGGCFAAPCVPWSSDPVSAGCAIDQWCLPDPLDALSGECQDGSGTLGEGDACPMAGDDCGPGMICADGSCTVICEPDAIGGSNGDTCGLSQGCFQLSLDDGAGGMTPAAFGLCTDSCGYDEGTPCTEPTDSCVPGELYATSFDVCTSAVPSPPLMPGDDCMLAGLSEFSLCAETAVCLNTQQGLSCVYICRASEGALDTTNHPDCPDPQQTCASVFAPSNTLLGACM